MISPKWSLLICSFVHNTKSQQMWKIANEQTHTQRQTESAPLSVLIANFVYIRISLAHHHFPPCLIYFITWLRIFFAVLFFLTWHHFARVCYIFYLYYSPNYIHGVLLMNWQNIKNASIIFCVVLFFAFTVCFFWYREKKN